MYGTSTGCMGLDWVNWKGRIYHKAKLFTFSLFIAFRLSFAATPTRPAAISGDDGGVQSAMLARSASTA